MVGAPPCLSPKTHIHVRFLEEATFKQVKLRLHFNKLKWRHIHVPHSQCPTTFVFDG
ncbi:MAG: ligand-binding SRPBCC domain-containing protein [Phenylobacterium sp.]|jgi:ligand-binding SRPBCC domain-containing protein